MLDSVLARIPEQHRVEAGMWILFAAGWACAFAFGLLLHAHTIVRHQYRDNVASVRHMSAHQIVQALGKPDQSQTQNGITCGIWAAKGLEVCWK